MLRRLLTLVLMVPLSLNGLWMVCAEGAADSAEPNAEPAQIGEAKPECQGTKMCPLHKPAADETLTAATAEPSTGVICLLSSTGNGASLAAIGFLYAPPAAVESFATPEPVLTEVVEFASAAYADAPLTGETPPPRA